MSDKPFWQTKQLEEMTQDEWESLCDGCGKCCLNKLEDEDSGEVIYTNVACRLLDTETCSCKDYQRRFELVADCLILSSDPDKQFSWLPSTCAYRLLAHKQELPWWHPLVSGDKDTVHLSGNSVRRRVVSETETVDLFHHLIDWIE